MQQEFIIAVLAGLGGMFGWGFADFFAKKTVDKIGAINSLVWGHFFGTVALIIIAFASVVIFKQNFSFPNNIEAWAAVMFFGALQAFVYWFAYEGFGKGQLSVLNPVFASYSGIAVVLSIVLLGELITFPILLALIVIFGGVLLLSLDPKGLRSKKLYIFSTPGLKEVALAALLAAFWQLYWDKFLGGNDWIIYTLCMYGFMTLTAFVIAKIKKTKLAVKKRGVWKSLVLIGLCEVVAYLALSLGFTATSYTSIVIVIAGAFSLPTIILARVFLKEKVAFIQTIGSVIVIIGIILLLSIEQLM